VRWLVAAIVLAAAAEGLDVWSAGVAPLIHDEPGMRASAAAPSCPSPLITGSACGQETSAGSLLSPR